MWWGKLGWYKHGTNTLDYEGLLLQLGPDGDFKNCILRIYPIKGLLDEGRKGKTTLEEQ